MGIAEGTVKITKDYARPVDIVFAAWSQRDAQLAWGDPGDGWTMAFSQFHFAVGETDICRFGPVAGPEYLNENRYLVIEPGRRIVYATTLSCEGALTFAGIVAVEFEQTTDGTRQIFVEHGLYFDGLDDVSGHQAGWDGMLTALGRFVRRRQ